MKKLVLRSILLMSLSLMIFSCGSDDDDPTPGFDFTLLHKTFAFDNTSGRNMTINDFDFGDIVEATFTEAGNVTFTNSFETSVSGKYSVDDSSSEAEFTITIDIGGNKDMIITNLTNKGFELSIPLNSIKYTATVGKGTFISESDLSITEREVLVYDGTTGSEVSNEDTISKVTYGNQELVYNITVTNNGNNPSGQYDIMTELVKVNDATSFDYAEYFTSTNLGVIEFTYSIDISLGASDDDLHSIIVFNSATGDNYTVSELAVGFYYFRSTVIGSETTNTNTTNNVVTSAIKFEIVD